MNYRIIALGIMLLAGSAWPHHNMTALFDLNDRVTLNGTLTKFDWRNPHILLSVDVKNADGQTESWTIEGPPPSFFRTRAIGKGVAAEASRARDKSPSGLLRVVTLPGGKVVSACPQNC